MDHSSSFYGVATIGTKGQVVIPAKAREELGLKPTDQVIVIGRKGSKGQGMLCLFPASTAESFLEEITKKLSDVQSALEQAKHQEKD